MNDFVSLPRSIHRSSLTLYIGRKDKETVKIYLGEKAINAIVIIPACEPTLCLERVTCTAMGVTSCVGCDPAPEVSVHYGETWTQVVP